MEFRIADTFTDIRRFPTTTKPPAPRSSAAIAHRQVAGRPNSSTPRQPRHSPTSMPSSTQCRRTRYSSETFRVLKNNETRQFGEYRTCRLVLEDGIGCNQEVWHECVN